MRVTSGLYKNRKLAVPEGSDVRPTSGRMRQSLFNMLHHAKWLDGFEMEGAHALDLFCGSGALGLEALSHGAAHCVFVDRDLKTVRQNTRFLDGQYYSCVQSSLPKLAGLADKKFDLVFMDPPYRSGLVAPTLEVVTPYLNDKALIVIEAEKELQIQTTFEILDQRTQGISTLHVLRYHA